MTNDEDFQISADPSKYVTLPVQNEEIWRKYQMTLDWFWTVYDIYLANDKEDMQKTYNNEECKCILQLIAFMFATHHTTITKELFRQFITQIEIKEAFYYFGSQADAKKTHTMMYSILLDELLKDDKADKDKLISEVLKMSHVRNFIRWSIKGTTSSTRSFAQRLFAFAAIQAIIFEVPSLLFKYIEKQHPSKMPGLNHANDLIWRDEKLNLSFSCMLFEYIDDELTQEDAHQIVQEAVAHAQNIFTKSIPVSYLGMSDDLIMNYIEYSADKLLSDVHLSKLYNKDCPLDWFQEPRVDTYQTRELAHGTLNPAASSEGSKFMIDTDF